jgi:hypothetical protein
LLVPAWSIVVALLTYFTYFSMTIRGTPAFSDISTYTGRLVSILLLYLPFLLAKVSTLQIQEGNTRTPVIQILTLRTPDRMQYRRRMIYRLAWSIVCFTITPAPQENRSTYKGNYPSFLHGMSHVPQLHADPLVCMWSLTHKCSIDSHTPTSPFCLHIRRLSLYNYA